MPSTIILRRQRRRHGGSKVSHTRALWLRLLIASLSGLAITAGAVIILAVVGLFAAYNYFAKDLPSPEEVEQLTLSSFETTKIYDRTGEHLLYEVIDPQAGDRTIVSLQDMPLQLRQATIALEDVTFYDNPGGINIAGLARALYSNIIGNRITGGSSITAQLVRNVTMTAEERAAISYTRKIKEAILSIELTNRYPGYAGRDKILEWYLNTVSYGRIAVGVEAGAKLYFGKSVKDLTLAECAMLAAIPEYPALNPIDNPEAAKERQKITLDSMVKEGYITRAQADAAFKAEVGKPAQAEEIKIEAPHYVMYVLNELSERYGEDAVYGGGLQVTTTLDYDLQKQVEDILKKKVAGWPASANAHNAASVVVQPGTGEILAMAGSVDYNDKSIDGQVNMATASRQPGSSIKPYTYAAAFEQGFGPGTVLNDVRTTFPGTPPFVPENVDRVFHGPMSIRTALACSYNVPAVLTLDRIGIDSMLEMAHRMGITGLRDRSQIGLSVTLGGSEITLLDHTFAYSVFANNGVMAGRPVPADEREEGYRELDPVSVLKVVNNRGKTLEEYTQPTTKEVLNPQIAYQISNILSDNQARLPSYGPGNALELSRPAAAKTGTTNDYTDAWTMGYTPNVTVGVWVGNSNRSPMNSFYGGIAAGPIWHDIMEAAFKNLPKAEFVEPAGMKWVTIDATSGALPGPNTTRTVKELFRDGLAPTTADTMSRSFAICKASGLLARPECPADQIEHKTFVVYPTECGDWVRSTNQPQPPSNYCDQHGATPRNSDASITWPGLYGAVKGVAEIKGNARVPGFRGYRLEYGQGLEPAEWIPIGGGHGNSVDNNTLEFWDTTGMNGLYTLRLTVDGSPGRQVTLPVTVDNQKPTVGVGYPYSKEQFILEADELTNFQVDAYDNTAIDHVDFYVDGHKLGTSRVAPFSLGWKLVMSDVAQSQIPPIPNVDAGPVTGDENGVPMTWRRVKVPDGTMVVKELGSGDTITRTMIINDDYGLTYMPAVGAGGNWGKNKDTGQTEFKSVHKFEAIAFDTAGNWTKSDPVLIYIEHRKTPTPKANKTVTPAPAG